jgi:glycosidase
MCQEKKSGNQRVLIYQLLPRLFTNTNLNNKKFGTIEENGCGKLNHINEKALMEIRGLGITHVWITGVIEHATCTDYSRYSIRADHPIVVKGMAGSPYAVKDYYDIDPDLAEHVPSRMHEFEELVSRCHSRGLKVIIDFVPNHVARQYQSDAKPAMVEDLGERDTFENSFQADNNFYYLHGSELELPPELKNLPYVSGSPAGDYKEIPAKVTGNDKFIHNPGIFDWYETVKLNYGIDYLNGGSKFFDPVPDTWNKMLDILMFWAEKNVDGFRCDMAEMVPVEFWSWAIGRVKEKYPEIEFIAEIYNPLEYRNYIETGRFDYLYDKVGLYDTLRKVILNELPARAITLEWQKLNGIDARMLRFMENHDEQRIASRHFASEARAGLPAMGITALMNTGPVMIYFGQECGEPANGETGYSGDDGRTSIFDYCGVPEHAKWLNNGQYDGGQLSAEQKKVREFYKKLLQLSGNDVFSRGSFYDLMWNNPDSEEFDGAHIYTFLRYCESGSFLVIANFNRNEPFRVNVNFPGEIWDLLKLNDNFSMFGIDRLWDQKQFYSESKELKQNGLTVLLEESSVYAFKLEIS